MELARTTANGRVNWGRNEFNMVVPFVDAGRKSSSGNHASLDITTRERQILASTRESFWRFFFVVRFLGPVCTSFPERSSRQLTAFVFILRTADRNRNHFRFDRSVTEDASGCTLAQFQRDIHGNVSQDRF